MTHQSLALFEQKEIRKITHNDEWWFSIVDIVQTLTDQDDRTTARKYWNKLAERLRKEGSEVVTNCHQLKMRAEDGKMRLTDCANTETLLRIIQSIPSPKAEPFKRWLAQVGYERIQEIEDPELAMKRVTDTYEAKGYSKEWIDNTLVVKEMSKMTRYYVSNDGVDLVKKLDPLEKNFLTETDKYKSKIDANQLNIFDVIDDVKVNPSDREENLEAGYKCTTFNKYNEGPYDLNYDYYINECNKIINALN